METNAAATTRRIHHEIYQSVTVPYARLAV